MESRTNSGDDEVAEAALKLMGYKWDKSSYLEHTCLWKIKCSNGAKVHWVLPNTTTVSELYNYLTSLK